MHQRHAAALDSEHIQPPIALSCSRKVAQSGCHGETARALPVSTTSSCAPTCVTAPESPCHALATVYSCSPTAAHKAQMALVGLPGAQALITT